MTGLTVYTQTFDHPGTLPFRVDDSTTVTLDADHDIVIDQNPGYMGHNRITVRDAEALTRAMGVALAVRDERIANDSRPMLDEQRKAIFAAMTGMYGKGLSRARRLSIASKILQRDVESFSVKFPVQHPLTRAEASRLLDVLNA